MTIQFITAEHKDQLASIPARDMVRAHMINAIPQDGTMIAAADVTDYIRQMIGPIYELCAQPEQRGLEGAITNAQGTLAYNKGFIIRGGSATSPPDLPTGYWRFADGGYQAAKDWIRSDVDALIELAADIYTRRTDRDKPSQRR